MDLKLRKNQKEICSDLTRKISSGMMKKIIIIYGENGVGKTFLVNKLVKKFDQIKIEYLDFPLWFIEKLFLFQNDIVEQTNFNNNKRNIHIELMKNFFQEKKTLLIEDLNSLNAELIIFDNIDNIEFKILLPEIIESILKSLKTKILMVLNKRVYHGIEKSKNIDILNELQ